MVLKGIIILGQTLWIFIYIYPLKCLTNSLNKTKIICLKSKFIEEHNYLINLQELKKYKIITILFKIAKYMNNKLIQT